MVCNPFMLAGGSFAFRSSAHVFQAVKEPSNVRAIRVATDEASDSGVSMLSRPSTTAFEIQFASLACQVLARP